MKRLVCLLLSIAMIFAFAGCGSPQRESAESVVKNAIDAVKAYDESKISEYWGEQNEIEDSEAEDELDEECVKAIVSGITYEVLSSEESDEAASVEVKISNVDMATVLADTITELWPTLLADAFKDESEQMTEEESNQLFSETFLQMIQREDNQTKETTVTVQLSLQDDKWVIENQTDLADALLGGLVSAMSSMGAEEGGAETTDVPLTDSCEIEDLKVEIINAEKSVDDNGSPIVVVEYLFTNNSSEATSFSSGIVSTQVFQSGVEMYGDQMYFSDDYDWNAAFTEIKDGASISVYQAYPLSSESDPIEVDVELYGPTTWDSVKATQTFNLA